MKNFKVTAKEDGKEYWISRAICVVGIIICSSKDSNEVKFLVSQRGPGCPDYVGKWQCTCGYLDFDETLEEAMKREAKEELGLDLDKANSDGALKNFRVMEVVDDPKRDDRQNVSFRYFIELDLDWVRDEINSGSIRPSDLRGGEKSEVTSIRLVPSDKLEDYDWAFNHSELTTNVRNGLSR